MSNDTFFVGTAVSGTHIVMAQSLSNGSSFELVLRNSDTRNLSETVDKATNLSKIKRDLVHFWIIQDV